MTHWQLLLCCIASLLSSSPLTQEKSKEEIVIFPRFDPTDFKALKKALESDNLDSRKEALAALFFLRENGKPAIPALLKCLDHPNVFIRSSAAGLFNWYGKDSEIAIPQLIKLSKDPEVEVRRATVFTLQVLGKTAKQAAPALLQSLKDKDSIVSLRSAGALAKMGVGGKKPFEFLVKFFDHPNDELRTEAIHIIGDTGPAALPFLTKSLKNKKSTVRQAALGGIAEVISEIRGKKQKVPEDLIGALIITLNDENPDVIYAAIYTLSRAGQDAKLAIPGIIKCLKHPTWQVRMCAAWELREFGSEAKIAIPALREALNDEMEMVRREAKETIELLTK